MAPIFNLGFGDNVILNEVLTNELHGDILN